MSLPVAEEFNATVRVLTIGPAAMSITLYSQLDQVDLLTDNAEYRGTPWGRVNHSAGCQDVHDYERWLEAASRGYDLTELNRKYGMSVQGHAHVIWQRGENLVRCCLMDRPSPKILEPLTKRRRTLYELMLLSRCEVEKPEIVWNERSVSGLRWPDYEADERYGFHDTDLTRAFTVGEPWITAAKKLRLRGEVALALAMRPAADPDDLEWQGYVSEIETPDDEIQRLRDKWKARFVECVALPLLIIGTMPGAKGSR